MSCAGPTASWAAPLSAYPLAPCLSAAGGVCLQAMRSALCFACASRASYSAHACAHCRQGLQTGSCLTYLSRSPRWTARARLPGAAMQLMLLRPGWPGRQAAAESPAGHTRTPGRLAGPADSQHAHRARLVCQAGSEPSASAAELGASNPFLNDSGVWVTEADRTPFTKILCANRCVRAGHALAHSHCQAQLPQQVTSRCARRGEIAVRIFRAGTELGLRTVRAWLPHALGAGLHL